MAHEFNGPYTGEHLTRSGFPLGGIGAGMIALEGSGKLAQVSIRHRPCIFFEPLIFSAIHVRGCADGTRVLEGPPPDWKFASPWESRGEGSQNSGNGFYLKTYGLPLFGSTTFTARFPFATVDFLHDTFPLRCRLTAFSPFVPTDSQSASLPAAALRYTFTNTTGRAVEAVYSFHSHRHVISDRPRAGEDRPRAQVHREGAGFVITQPATPDDPALYGEFAAWCDAPQAAVDCAWFRGHHFDDVSMLMQKIARGDTSVGEAYTEGGPSTGGSLYVPLTLEPGQTRTVEVLLSWYVPASRERHGDPPGEPCCAGGGEPLATYRPWYATRFSTGRDLQEYWRREHDRLRRESALFSEAFFSSTLPPEVLEAVSANLSILKSPTVLRQHDGRLWAWEGCGDEEGSCYGNCTHVWNYAQAICHLFPDLERTLRETEFTAAQNEEGWQSFRVPLPIGEPRYMIEHAAADGQLGGLLKLYREWRISGDTDWLRGLWPAAAAALDYCIRTWDPDEIGLVAEPHHNTYDIEFWGPDGLCTSFYLGALKAASLIARALGEEHERYDRLHDRGRRAMEDQLFNGEYFFQQVRWRDLHAQPPHVIHPDRYSAEALAMLEAEGPKYQYGTGCLSDGVLGAWIARVCGIEEDLLDPSRVSSHLESVFRYSFRETLVDHINPQRCGYACGDEAGLLLCSWPKGGRPSLPFIYSEEVWTGIEYQVASHLMMMGHTEEGLAIVRAVRSRYNGVRRNPFNEFECGHWYARALASYGLLQGMTGIRYDAIDRTLTVAPRIPGDFRSFLCTATGFGMVCVRDGDVSVDVRHGEIDVQHIKYISCTEPP